MPSCASWLGGMSLVMFSHRNNRKHPGVHFMWWHTATQHKSASKLSELMLCKMGLPANLPVALGQCRLQGSRPNCEQAASKLPIIPFASCLRNFLIADSHIESYASTGNTTGAHKIGQTLACSLPLLQSIRCRTAGHFS